MQFFSFFIQSNFEFYLMNAPVYVDIDQGIHKVKLKNALNEKRKKLHGFSFSINIANFEAFHWTKKLISNLFFLKSDQLLLLGMQLREGEFFLMNLIIIIQQYAQLNEVFEDNLVKLGRQKRGRNILPQYFSKSCDQHFS